VKRAWVKNSRGKKVWGDKKWVAKGERHKVQQVVRRRRKHAPGEWAELGYADEARQVEDLVGGQHTG
jgi:hypothetical protein